MNKNDILNQKDLKLLHEALTATGERLYALLHHFDPEIIKTLLKNRALNQDHLLIISKRQDLSSDCIATIYAKNEQFNSHPVLLALARNSATDGHILRKILPFLRTFELLDICLLPRATADVKLAAERIILQRIPTAPLGHKITLARRGTTAIVAALLASSAESVDRRLLKLEHCLLWMDKMFFAETIKSSPEKDNADKDFTEQSRAIQVVRLRLRLRHAGWWHGSLGH